MTASLRSSIGLVLGLVASLSLAAPAAVDDGPIFRAMEDELARAKSLKLEKQPAPYYLSAWTHDDEGFAVQASFGALTGRGNARRGGYGVTVRVGDPSLDNSNFRDFSDFSFLSVGQGHGRGAPAEPDYDALRQGLWLTFDGEYKSAIETLSKKRAFLDTKKIAGRPADFGPAPVANKLFPELALHSDSERWTQLVQKASAVFRTHPSAQTGEAAYGAQRRRQYFVSSDPGRTRFDELLASFTISASGQAPDGMEVHARYEADGRTETDLPSDADLLKAADKVAKQLDALVKAPVLAEDYSGPVLFVGPAADTFFLQTIGEPLSSPRDDLGDPRQGRMTDRLGKHIASKFVSVRDDPTQDSWNGQPLLGFYPVDDDGVLPQPIQLVKDGVLQTYFMSRIPTAKVAKTNGHCRGTQGSASNLFVETSQPVSRAELKKQLIEIAKEEDLDYGLLVEDFEGGGERHMFDNGTGNIYLPNPSMVYRVYPDGREELVRGLRFKPAPYRVLKDVVALGSEPTLLNTLQRGQRVSIVAPSVLVKTMDVQRPNEELDKPPVIPRPSLAANR